MTRRWKEKVATMAGICKTVPRVDKGHLLGDQNRGWCRETVVIRMKMSYRAAEAVNVTDAPKN